jgi:hypothetical protein
MLGNKSGRLGGLRYGPHSLDFNGPPTAFAATEYLLLSKRARQVLEIEAGTAWKPSKRPA